MPDPNETKNICGETMTYADLKARLLEAGYGGDKGWEWDGLFRAYKSANPGLCANYSSPQTPGSNDGTKPSPTPPGGGDDFMDKAIEWVKSHPIPAALGFYFLFMRRR